MSTHAADTRHLGPSKHVGWRARLLLVAGGVLAAVLAAELMLRVLGLGYGNVHMDSSDLLHHAHPPNHRFVSYHRSGEYGGHVVYYDEAGRRADPDAVPDAGSGPTGLVVAFMGDSFVEALQVSHADSFVGLLQQQTKGRVRVYNYGTSSYSPAVYLLQWRHQVKPVSPSYVFLMLFGNDVRDDIEMTEIAARRPDGDLVSVSGRPDSSLARLARATYVGRLVRKVQLQLAWRWAHRGDVSAAPQFAFVEENPEVSGVTSRYLSQLADEVQATGATLVLMAVPSRDDVLSKRPRPNRSSFHDHVQRWAEAYGVPFVDLATPFIRVESTDPLFFARDIHFTAAGHRVVAHALSSAYPEVFGE